MIILDLIFKKEFDDDSKSNYSIQVQRNFNVLGSFLYIIFSNFIKEHTSNQNKITENMRIFLADKKNFMLKNEYDKGEEDD